MRLNITRFLAPLFALVLIVPFAPADGCTTTTTVYGGQLGVSESVSPDCYFDAGTTTNSFGITSEAPFGASLHWASNGMGGFYADNYADSTLHGRGNSSLPWNPPNIALCQLECITACGGVLKDFEGCLDCCAFNPNITGTGNWGAPTLIYLADGTCIDYHPVEQWNCGTHKAGGGG